MRYKLKWHRRWKSNDAIFFPVIAMPKSRGIRRSRKLLELLPKPPKKFLRVSSNDIRTIPTSPISQQFDNDHNTDEIQPADQPILPAQTQLPNFGETLLSNSDGDPLPDPNGNPIPQAGLPIHDVVEPGGDPDEDYDLEDFPDIVIKNWLVLWSVYLSTGSNALSESVYNIIRNLLSVAFRSNHLYWRAGEAAFLNLQAQELRQGRASLPSTSHIYASLRPEVLQRLAPQIDIRPLPITEHPGAAFSPDNIPENPISKRTISIVISPSYRTGTCSIVATHI